MGSNQKTPVRFRCKMVVNTVLACVNSEQINASPVTDGTPEDNSFSQWTPSGSLDLTISNPDLMGKIKPGAKFYGDFSEIIEETE